MAEEIELKLTAPDRGHLDRLAALEELCGYSLLEVGRRFVQDVYYDTAEFQLLKVRCTFRVRRFGGICCVTFKEEGEEVEGIHRREEHEVEIADPEALIAGELDVEPYRRAKGMVGDAPLVEALRVENHRRDLHLTRDGRAYYKLMLDDVEFIGPRGRERFREVEIENAGGGMEDMRKMHDFLKDRFNLKPSGPSKYATGMGMVGGLR